MRKRSHLFHSSFETNNDEEEDVSSDPEENIQAVEPDEEQQPVFFISSSDNKYNRHQGSSAAGLGSALVQRTFHSMKEANTWWAKCLTIFFTACLTYSFRNTGEVKTNVQIAIMTVITLVGASPFCSTHLILASIGAFVGGQNIIGSTGPFESNNQVHAINYLWLFLLSFVVGWCFVLVSKFRILDGYSGRLGTTTFIGMNVVMLLVFGHAGVVDWDRYYYGLVYVINVAEEDSAPPLASAWEWTEKAELAIGYVMAVIWLGLVGGATRIFHHRYIQGFASNQKSKTPPGPLNNVLVPVLWALLSMLIVNATNYRHAAGLYNGFAVGSYVAMASLQKIPTVFKFVLVSAMASVWGLALTPFFVGFSGKSGFTAMLGHVTLSGLEVLLEKLRIRRIQEERRVELMHRQEETEMRRLQQLQQQEQHQPVSNAEGPPSSQSQASPTITNRTGGGGRKYVKPKEPLYTKKQRRQQQRLQVLQRQQSQQEQQQQKETIYGGGGLSLDENVMAVPKTPVLHHRAWSALPTTADEIWHHPLGDPTSNPEPPIHRVV
eukprot:scaffold17595_cov113-Cylindrotheca_fusiformis.AAC.12